MSEPRTINDPDPQASDQLPGQERKGTQQPEPSFQDERRLMPDTTSHPSIKNK